GRVLTPLSSSTRVIDPWTPPTIVSCPSSPTSRARIGRSSTRTSKTWPTKASFGSPPKGCGNEIEPARATDVLAGLRSGAREHPLSVFSLGEIGARGALGTAEVRAHQFQSLSAAQSQLSPLPQ